MRRGVVSNALAVPRLPPVSWDAVEKGTNRLELVMLQTSQVKRRFP